MLFVAALNLNFELLKNLTLIEIEKLLQNNRRSLKEFPSMPYLNDFAVNYCGNRLVYAELDYNKDDELRIFETNFSSMTGKFLFLIFLQHKSLLFI